MKKYNIKTENEKIVILNFHQKNGSKKTYEKYGISRSTVASWKARIAQAGPNDKHPLARRYMIGPDIIAHIKQIRKENPTISLEEIRLKAAPKYKISITSIWHIINGR